MVPVAGRSNTAEEPRRTPKESADTLHALGHPAPRHRTSLLLKSQQIAQSPAPETRFVSMERLLLTHALFRDVALRTNGRSGRSVSTHPSSTRPLPMGGFRLQVGQQTCRLSVAHARGRALA